MGFFDLASPLLSVLDGLLGFIPPSFRIVVWGVISSALTMFVYWWSSPQEKIGDIRDKAVAARKKLIGYDGDEFDEYIKIATDVLKMSGKHFLVVTGPAIIGGLPVLFVIVWMSNVYGYQFPAIGTSVALNAYPDATQVQWPADSVATEDGSRSFDWPAAPIALSDTSGNLLTTIPMAAAIPVIEQRYWWNSLLGNPSGYLDAATSVQTITIDIPPQTFFEIGPSWLHGWEAPYFIVLVAFSIAIKIRFKIN
ncbi:MAG: hypothetical protein ACR2P6_08010 [Gammaproteobacteria bacterium]